MHKRHDSCHRFSIPRRRWHRGEWSHQHQHRVQAPSPDGRLRQAASVDPPRQFPQRLVTLLPWVFIIIVCKRGAEKEESASEADLKWSRRLKWTETPTWRYLNNQRRPFSDDARFPFPLRVIFNNQKEKNGKRKRTEPVISQGFN